ncbi:NAC domain-containing protein 30-like [Oryza brachyantha]|nr:NAC domain-containing protein 30-like [Oryza brachyantha]
MAWREVPPGFRFQPTEEELVGYYLARKVQAIAGNGIIPDLIHLCSVEPWDLRPRDCCYFFTYKGRKYPTGTRTNRATAAGFWKATGRDKPVLSSTGSPSPAVIGMRKTLVFYLGRAPNGTKTDWIIHEYRLVSVADHQEGWVVCRAFQKPTTFTLQSPPLLHLQQHMHGDSGLVLASPPAPAPADGDKESNMLLTPGAAGDPVADHHSQLLAMMKQQAGAIDWSFLDALLLHDST